MLKLSGISITFKDAAGKSFEALGLESLAFAPATLTVISGPSGSGKSTLLHVVAGLLPLARGTITWNDTVISHYSESRRDRWRLENVGYIFQDFQLIAEMGPEANVALPGSFGAKRPAADRAKNLLSSLAVPASRRRVSQLSRGEQQRVAFARALYFDPALILADEPTASLDEKNATGLIEQLLGQARQGKTVIAASHDNALITRAQVHIRLSHGHLAEQG